MNSLRNIVYCLILTALVASMNSCNTEESRRISNMKEKRAAFVKDSLALKIGILPTSDCDHIRKASELGIFDSLGVDVHLRNYKALSECRWALRSGAVEGAVVDSSLARIIENKDKIKLVYGPSTSLSWKLISARKARIVRVSQLVDKIIAADSHGASHDFVSEVTDSLIKKGNNIFIVQVEDPTIRLKMLNVGNIDAAALPEPFASDALKNGGRLLCDASQKSKGVIALSDKKLKDKRIRGQYELFLKGCEIGLDSLKNSRK